MARPAGGLAGALVEATKPRITRLVTITSGVGFAMAGLSRSWRAEELALVGGGCVVGTALCAAGANALNQWMERDRDARMIRTCARPLPMGRASPSSVLWSGIGLGVSGTLVLLALCGWVPAALALACIVVYVAAYTPLKPLTPWATHVGTIPGALPPLIGWTAASGGGGIEGLGAAGGWSLYALMTVWQMPHFLAIAWMYKDDYLRGGYRVLPALANGENKTVRSITMWTTALIPATLAPAWAMWGTIGWGYLAVAVPSGALVSYLAWRLIQRRTREAARTVFFASIVHLPVLLLAMVAEGLIRAIG
ncbi:MAG: protoheme IX farnesyltransferase [Phycisphaerae bacterium]|nr:protoheme IX farnesyltransferase [Phycisphaerae bacterium]